MLVLVLLVIFWISGVSQYLKQCDCWGVSLVAAYLHKQTWVIHVLNSSLVSKGIELWGHWLNIFCI